MSTEAMGWTIRHSPYAKGAFTVHLMIADSVNDQHGHELWMTQSNLATKCRLGRTTVNQAVSQMCEDGYLELLEDRSAMGLSNRYRFLYPETAEVTYETRQTLSGNRTGGVSGNRTGGVSTSRTGVSENQTGPVQDLNSREPKNNPSETQPCKSPPASPGEDHLMSSRIGTMVTEQVAKHLSATTLTSDHLPDAIRLVKHMLDLLKANKVNVPAATAHKTRAEWLQESERLLRIGPPGEGGHVPDIDEAMTVATWATSDGFWRSNIHSAPTFRQKYDRLRLQATEAGGASAEAHVDWTGKRGAF